jgi:hypothetical protein
VIQNSSKTNLIYRMVGFFHVTRIREHFWHTCRKKKYWSVLCQTHHNNNDKNNNVSFQGLHIYCHYWYQLVLSDLLMKNINEHTISLKSLRQIRLFSWFESIPFEFIDFQQNFVIIVIFFRRWWRWRREVIS